MLSDTKIWIHVSEERQLEGQDPEHPLKVVIEKKTAINLVCRPFLLTHSTLPPHSSLFLPSS